MVFTEQRLKAHPPRFRSGHTQHHCQHRPSRDTSQPPAPLLCDFPHLRRTEARPARCRREVLLFARAEVSPRF
jgi:hypothetical protein